MNIAGAHFPISQRITGIGTTISNIPESISEKVFDYALKLFVVISTFFYLAGPPGADPIVWNYQTQELFFRYGVMLLYGLSLFSSKKRNFKCGTVAFFLVYSLVASFLFQFDLGARRVILNSFLGIVFYQLVYERARLDEIKKYAIWLFGIVTANLVLCFFQWFDKDLIFYHIHSGIVPISEKICGFMRIQAALGMLGAIIAPILFAIHPLVIMIALPLIFWGKSSISVAALVASLGLITWFRLKRWQWFLIAGIITLSGLAYIALYDMPQGQFNERYKIWYHSVKYVLSSQPFTGLGMGSFAQWEPQQSQIGTTEKLSWIWAHNEYIQVLFEMGICGFVAVLYFLKGRFEDFRKAMHDSEVQILAGSFLSILIVSIAQFPFHAAKMVVLCVFLMALFHSKAKEESLERI